jgi:hypothetical protein
MGVAYAYDPSRWQWYTSWKAHLDADGVGYFTHMCYTLQFGLMLLIAGTAGQEICSPPNA